MMSRGHDVCVICAPGSRLLVEAPRYQVPVVALPVGRKRLAGLLAVRRWLRENPVDVVNTHSSTDSWLVALACLGLSVRPAIVRTRHISAEVKDGWANRWLYGRAARHVVTTGESLRTYLVDRLQLDPGAVTSVPTGIDPERFFPGDKQACRGQLGLPGDAFLVGIVATLRSWKGHLYLLEAFAAARKPHWRLLIIGEGPMREPIEARIASLGLADSVSLVGQQAAPEGWLRALDAFCLPSYANEGVPQAVLQAMLSSLPIVSTPVGAIPEALTHDKSALLVAPKDSGALAAALLRIEEDAALAERLGRTALMHARERFSRAGMLDRMGHIFAGACK